MPKLDRTLTNNRDIEACTVSADRLNEPSHLGETAEFRRYSKGRRCSSAGRARHS